MEFTQDPTWHSLGRFLADVPPAIEVKIAIMIPEMEDGPMAVGVKKTFMRTLGIGKENGGREVELECNWFVPCAYKVSTNSL